MAPTCDSDEPVDTVIFVDVDGVLNVGIRDQADAPLLFNEFNRNFALSQQGQTQRTQQDEVCVQKLLCVAKRPLPLHGEGATFYKLACSDASHVSEVLAGRIAQVVRAAGQRKSVVLASNWRKPKSAGRVRQLEAEVSKHLSSRFVFDGKTDLVEERCAADRLRCIGDYIESLCRSGRGVKGGRRLRVLVLEDFFITPMDGWSCGGYTMDSTADAEAYLVSRAQCGANVEVKVVHTYDEWIAPNGLRMQVGVGFSNAYLREALDFLGAAAPWDTDTPKKQEQSQDMRTPTSPAGPTKVVKNLKPFGMSCGKRMVGVDPSKLVEFTWIQSISSALPWIWKHWQRAI